MQSSPASRHFLLLRYNYSPKHPALKNHLSLLLPKYERQSFTPIQNNV
jgi:hypothetical protein